MARTCWASELILRASRGEETAWEEILKFYQDPLQNYVERRLDPRIRSRISSEDILQETMFEAWKRIGDYAADPSIPFALWLRRLASDRVLDHYRRNFKASKRTIFLEFAGRSWEAGKITDYERSADCLELVPCKEPTPLEALMRQEQFEFLYKALEALPLKERAIVNLRYFEGNSTRTIARRLNISEGAVRVRQVRAIKRLQLKMRPLLEPSTA